MAGGKVEEKTSAIVVIRTKQKKKRRKRGELGGEAAGAWSVVDGE